VELPDGPGAVSKRATTPAGAGRGDDLADTDRPVILVMEGSPN